MSKLFTNTINGILLLNKPLNLTSNAALQRARYFFRAKKAGHTGSLDPLASGMLPICFGEATKFSQYLLDADKYYQVIATLGVTTSTGDAEGEITKTAEVVNFSEEKLLAILPDFTGKIAQIPPMFSAVKHQGQPLYKLARRGIEIERQARTVTIHDIRILATTENTFTLHVHCSKGTYIRTLIEDMGAALGFGAYVSGLHRSAVTPYESNSMITLDELELLDNNLTALKPLLLPVNTVVQAMPFIELTKEAVFYIKQGQAVMSPKRNMTGSIQLIDDKGLFMGIGEMLEDGRVAPKRLIEVKAS